MVTKAERPAVALKTHWFHILLSLVDGDQHGYGIMREVLERTDGKVRLWPATLYGSLRRLVDAGLIEESNRGPSSDDMRRRFYHLTPDGGRVVAAEIRRLEDLLRAARAKGRSLNAESGT
jgi:DNA-binding PadR family transcriptional regulator